MENIKYITFYALLVIVIALGVLQWHWVAIFPAALVLSFAYIIVKGKSWRQIMGKAEMNTNVVFIGVLLSQLVLAGIFYGIGRIIASFLN